MLHAEDDIANSPNQKDYADGVFPKMRAIEG